MNNKRAEWTFPLTMGGEETGLSNSDAEMFRKDTIAGLAREILQNSIDAKENDNLSVRVEFSCFDANPNDIPGLKELEDYIMAGIKTWKGKNDGITDGLKYMLQCIRKKKISVCRISDFNTTGLRGVSNLEDTASPWHDLTKGSGLSNKSETSGGSKGVGKNATFSNSEFCTVFYSTKTDQGETGSIGVAKICTVSDYKGKKGRTQGVGYYSIGEFCDPLPEELNLDPKFNRTECGTDIYIIGFRKSDTWEEEVIAKVLESFMTTFFFGSLEVKVGRHTITRNNIRDYVFDKNIIDSETPIGKEVVMQYYLLTECKEPHVIHLDNYGEATLYFLNCINDYEKYRPSKSYCTMVRYPYMKIKNVPIKVNLQFAAMCVIGDNELNARLRKIENPQHDAWEFNRLTDGQARYKDDVTRIYKHLINEITDYIRKRLMSTDLNQVNLVGTEDYLPNIDDGDENKHVTPTVQEKKVKINSKPTVSKRKTKSVSINMSAQYADSTGNGIIPEFAGETGEETDIIVPQGHNDVKNGEFHIGDNESRNRTGGNEKLIAARAELRPMKYRFACTNKNAGMFAIMFTSDVTVDDAEIELNAIDFVNDSETVEIYDATVNGEPAEVSNNRTVHLSLVANEKVTVVVHTNKNELFSSEVKVYGGHVTCSQE